MDTTCQLLSFPAFLLCAPCSAAACYPSLLLPSLPLTTLDSTMTCSTFLTLPETWSLQSPPSQRASGQQSQMGPGRAAVEQHNSIQWSIAFRGVWGGAASQECTVLCVAVGGVQLANGPAAARFLSELHRQGRAGLRPLRPPASPRPAAPAQCPPAVG